ncbi:MAG: glycosyl transferase family 1 [Ardenticatenales bacterium]|nr:glycosyl transferase family 1 [Ardenticatenales bacterium]
MRIGFTSTRLAGTDGVSLETAKWAEVVRRLGHEVYYCAGELGPDAPSGLLVPEMHFTHQDVRWIQDSAFGSRDANQHLRSRIASLTAKLKTQLMAFVSDYQIDLIIPENVFAIPMHIPLAEAWREVLLDTGLPAIAHNHDFYWERERFQINSVPDILESTFPPDLPNLRHVVINSLAQADLKKRRGIESIAIPNVFDFPDPAGSTDDTPARGIDDYSGDLRQAIGLSAGDILILQPTRVVPRKGIELSIDLCSRLNTMFPNVGRAEDTARTVLVITHRAGDEGLEYLHRLQKQAAAAGVDLRYVADLFDSQRGTAPDGRKIYSLWDAYPHADFVTYPSLCEGFGNALLETIYFRLPAMVNRYPVYLADIGPLGFDLVEIDGNVSDQAVSQAHHLLTHPSRRQQRVDHNFELGRRHFSYRALAAALGPLLDSFQR